MRRLLLLIVIGISMRPVSGQGVWERGRDSLLNALKHAKTDSAAGVTMIYLAAQYEYNNQDSALYFSRRAYQASERAHSLWGMVNGLSVQAGILADQFKLIEAIALDSQAIVLSAKANFKPGLAGVYNNIAIAYNRLGENATSIDYYLKAIAIYQELHDKHNICMAYANIGGVYPALHVIGLSTSDQASVIRKMQENGASGYLLKDAGKQEVLTALRTVSQGKTFVSFSVAEVLKKRTPDSKLPALTRREKEVLELIAEGLTNQEIATRLFLTSTTIDSHRKNMLTKFNAKNTAALIKIAVSNHLI